jgi:hypothetical protein
MKVMPCSCTGRSAVMAPPAAGRKLCRTARQVTRAYATPFSVVSFMTE